MSSLAAILRPTLVGPVEVKNRIVSTSHQTTLVDAHLPTADLIAYHEARARGGVGAIFLEATAIHPSGLLTPATLGGYLPEIEAAYRALAEAVRPHGTRLFVQLFHGGREQISVPPRPPALAPSAVPTLRFKTEPRAMTVREITELIEGFVRSARLACAGGLDGVEISMAHGYLAGQFFAAQTNRRTDRYGGDLSGRVRFGREVLAAVREAIGPDRALVVRVAADEVTPGGLGPQACADVAAALIEGGLADAVSLAMGHSATYVGSTWIVPPPPEEAVAIGGPAAVMRATLGSSVPIIATTRVQELSEAAELISSGRADLVGMTRALIADPDLVRHAELGTLDQITPCIGCNQGCIGHYHNHVPISCLVNPRTGRERHLQLDARPRRGDRTVVVGAGPGGLAAACEAARLGDDVTLYERGPGIGGQLRIAGHAPAHREMVDRYLALQSGRLDRLGVDVRLGVPATVDHLGSADRVILAQGARPFQPGVALAGAPTSVSAWEAIADPDSVRGPVLIIDWGGEWSGLDAAERLALAGREVTLASAATVPGETLHQYQRNGYLGRLHRLGVRIRHHVELDAATGGLRHVFSGAAEAPEAPGAHASVVLSQGRVPVEDLWQALEGDPRCVRVGDMLGPRSAEEAIAEGFEAARRERG